MRRNELYLIFAFVIFVLASCAKDKGKLLEPGAPAESIEPYSQYVPSGWPIPKYTFDDNMPSYDKFTLGRYMFYEPMLSRDSSLACGNCHKQVFGFTNGPDHPVSHGVNDIFGKRNAPALFNLAWSGKYMWDGGVNNLEMQPLSPLTNPFELGLNITDAIKRMNASAKYKNLFKKAFGDTIINSQRILRSFAQFLGLLQSYSSKYDHVKGGQDIFTENENAGYTVYKQYCSSCHVEPLFTDYSFRNKGLPINSYQDSGRCGVTQDPLDLYKFKVPSLRNLGFTSPYMHDGRFLTITEVIDFFCAGGAKTPNLDPIMATTHPLTTQEKSDLITFLSALNDYTFIADSRFSEIH